MAFTQADLDLLDRAIADGRGARTMTFGDQSVTFFDPEQMKTLRSLMAGEVAAAAGTSRTRFAATSKGV